MTPRPPPAAEGETPSEGVPPPSHRQRRRNYLTTGSLIGLWLLAWYGKARLAGAGAWEGILWVLGVVSVVGALVWAWDYGGKLRERDERQHGNDGGA